MSKVSITVTLTENLSQNINFREYTLVFVVEIYCSFIQLLVWSKCGENLLPLWIGCRLPTKCFLFRIECFNLEKYIITTLLRW